MYILKATIPTAVAQNININGMPTMGLMNTHMKPATPMAQAHAGKQQITQAITSTTSPKHEPMQGTQSATTSNGPAHRVNANQSKQKANKRKKYVMKLALAFKFLKNVSLSTSPFFKLIKEKPAHIQVSSATHFWMAPLLFFPSTLTSGLFQSLVRNWTLTLPIFGVPVPTSEAEFS